MDFKAKPHSVLNSLKEDLHKGYLETDVMAHGHKFRLHTLNEDDETWADSFVRSTTAVAVISSRKAPRVAASIMSVDDISIADLFQYPDDMPAVIRKNLDESPLQKKSWVREQMLYFISEDTNRPFVDILHEALAKLEEERDEVLKAIPNS